MQKKSFSKELDFTLTQRDIDSYLTDKDRSFKPEEKTALLLILRKILNAEFGQIEKKEKFTFSLRVNCCEKPGKFYSRLLLYV